MCEEGLPTADQIYAIHEEIVREYDLTHSDTLAILPDQKLASARSQAADANDPYRRAATLLRKLIVMHIFEDGNKRTAWLATYHYLDRLECPPEMNSGEVVRVLKHIKRFDVDELAQWLRNGDIDTSRLREY